MSDQFLGELRCFPFDFAPYQWAQAQGQILSIQSNTALFSLLGTYYGGNGTSNFALPDLQGNLVICQGQGLGLSDYVIGEQGGSASVTLLTSEMPAHNHGVHADAVSADVTTPIASALARPKGTTVGNFTNSTVTPGVQLSPLTITPTTIGNQPHDNMMPYLAMNWCIALYGIFPQRS